MTEGSFSPVADLPEQQAELLSAVEQYLAALRENGQLCGEAIVGWVRGVLRVSAYAARPDALHPQFHCEAASRYLAIARTHCRSDPYWRILDDAARQPHEFAHWRSEPSLYLYTHAFLATSAIRAGSVGAPIPPYLFPLTDGQRRDLHYWASAYRQYERVWLDSGELELPAYRQLSDPRSELARRGRQFCQLIETATEVPTFYSLDYYPDRADAEQLASCPVCSKNWFRGEKHGRSPEDGIEFFDYRCDACRLLLLSK